jgi:hypothetical protein
VAATPGRHVSTTTHGFTWGPATVTRMAELPDGSRCVRVAGREGTHVDVYVSAKGRRVRTFRGAVELLPPGDIVIDRLLTAIDDLYGCLTGEQYDALAPDTAAVAQQVHEQLCH